MTATISQTDAILALLQSRPFGITPMDALDEVGCFRLAARISELRAAGHVIATYPETYRGKTVARYCLIPPEVVKTIDAAGISESEQRALWGDR